MTERYLWICILLSAAVTALIRFAPFAIWGRGEKRPAIIEKLGRVLPYSVMAMLVVYCLKGVEFSALSGWLPEAIACAAVAGLHLWRRNTLLSILGGTLVYMFLVQFVF